VLLSYYSGELETQLLATEDCGPLSGGAMLNNGQSVQTLLCCFPMVALYYLWLPSVALCYQLLHIGEDHTLYIYIMTLSLLLGRQSIHLIHPFIL
jgi:hypothetical protein